MIIMSDAEPLGIVAVAPTATSDTDVNGIIRHNDTPTNSFNFEIDQSDDDHRTNEADYFRFPLQLDRDNVTWHEQRTFWFNFAFWPFVWIVCNGMMISYVDDNVADFMVPVLIFVNAYILYRSVVILEKSIIEYDTIVLDRGSETDWHLYGRPQPNSLSNIYAQASRKIDSLLGRGAQPPVSIFVSLLWLLLLGFVTLGIYILVVLALFFSSHCHVSSLLPTNPALDNMPNEIRNWSQDRPNPTAYSAGAGLIRLSNGVTFIAAADPIKNASTNCFGDFHSMESHDGSQLASIAANGELRYFPNVKDPYNFVSVSGDNELHAGMFCCIYTSSVPASLYRWYEQIPERILCVKSSDDISGGVLPNTTLYERKLKKYSFATTHSPSTINVYNNSEVWVKLHFTTRYRTGHMEDEYFELYKLIPSTPLQLNFIARAASNTITLNICEPWMMRFVVSAVTFTLARASAWLLVVKNMTAGMVPLCVATSVLLTFIDIDWCLTLCSITAIATLVALVGFVQHPFAREKLVWSLYTFLFVILFVFSYDYVQFKDEFNTFEWGLLVYFILAFVGLLLNHPVLYLLGWMIAVGTSLFGILLLFTPQLQLDDIFALVFGGIVGTGSVKLGYCQIHYQERLLRSKTCAWTSIYSSMLQPNIDFLTNRYRHHITTSRYASVPPTPVVSIRMHDATDDVENDLRTTLLVTRNSNTNQCLQLLNTNVPEWKLWFSFVLWLIAFLSFNGICVLSLSLLDARVFPDVPVEMMLYKCRVVTILLLVDVVVIYRSIVLLEKDIYSFDATSGTDQDPQRSQFRIPGDAAATAAATVTHGAANDTPTNVHAKMSRKMDSFLGLGTKPRVSISINVLWLLLIGCGTICIASFTEWCLLMSSRALHPTAWNPVTDASRLASQIKTKTKIDAIPDELQAWAHQLEVNTLSCFFRLSNGATYFFAKNPLDVDNGFREDSVPPQLVSTRTDGTIQFFPNILGDRSCISVAGESNLNSDGFCCLYADRSQLPKDFEQQPTVVSISVLCVNLTDDTRSGIFSNVTFGEIPNDVIFVSLASNKNELWVQLVGEELDVSTIPPAYTIHKYQMRFYRIITYPTMKLELEITTEVEVPKGDSDHLMQAFGGVEGINDQERTIGNIVLVVVILILIVSSRWLLNVKQMSVGAVPAWWAISLILSCVDVRLSRFLCTMLAGIAFLALLRCTSLPVHREILVWCLYTWSCFYAIPTEAGGYNESFSFHSVWFVVVIATLVGFILNHPVLYLLGWMSGVVSVVAGICLLFIPHQQHHGVLVIVFGIIIGCGGVALGNMLIVYRTYGIYLVRRIWADMNHHMFPSTDSTRGNRSMN
jgi:hypothetical protein